MSNQNICTKNAPPIFYVLNSACFIMQGCCNSWTCPRCGLTRAKQEYRKIIYGATTLSERGHDLYFITLTCRGRDMSIDIAERDYYKWTTRLLNACRNEFNRRGGYWSYCQVTERQKRLHPHSHLITTYLPCDAVDFVKTGKLGQTRDVLKSDWFLKRSKSAGLGSQYEITKINSAKAVSSYVAKYLFKDAILTEWPKGWRRIRYSRKWPRDTEIGATEGFPLLSKADWYRVKQRQVSVTVNTISLYNDARKNGIKVVRFNGGKEEN